MKRKQMVITILIVWTFYHAGCAMDEFPFRCREPAIKMCTCQQISPYLFKVDCSNSGLNMVPKGIPMKTTHLNLDDNRITGLNRGSFIKGKTCLSNLIKLSINNNKLKKISPGTFTRLHFLQELHLYNNNLYFNTSLPPGIFKPLNKSLKVLDIRKNLLTDITLTTYPISVAELGSLEELRMDCLEGKPLPVEYANLYSLQKLIFDNGRGNLRIVANDTFDAVSKLQIKEISLSGLGISFIWNGTFSDLEKLETLDVSDNPDLSYSMSQFTTSLKNTSITKLKLNNTGIGRVRTPTALLLKNFCHLPLKELLLDHNFLNVLDPVFTECFPMLEVLSLADNYMLLQTSLIYDTIFGLPNLIGFNMSWQRRANYHHTERHKRSIYRPYNGISLDKKTLNFTLPVNDNQICEEGMTCPVILPDNITWIDISHNAFVLVLLPQLVFLNNNSLTYFSVSFSGLQTAKLPMYCAYNVIPKLETFDASNNALQCVNATVFDGRVTHCDWSSLKRFYLRNNKLGHFEGNVCNEDKQNILGFLKPLEHLEFLDLAMNSFDSEESLSQLENLTNIEVLDLSSNGFRNFSLNLHNMRTLSTLNLSLNNLQCLSQATILQLNRLQERKTQLIHVDLSSNQLRCNCGCFFFFQWISVTKIVLPGRNSYHCVFDSGKRQSLSDIFSIVSELESECFNSEWLKIYISVEVAIFFAIAIFCLSYRMRHDIWYIYLRLKLNRQKLKALLDQKVYTYTAFVSCDHRDAKYFVIRKLLPNLETAETNLKFCIAQRDFIVGATIIDNILKSMHKSKKIIFIISEYFLKSNWCKEELIIAHQISLERGTNLIICIFMPNVQQRQLPGTLRLITKTVTCIKWSPDPNAQKVFWLMLHKGLVDEEESDHLSLSS